MAQFSSILPFWKPQNVSFLPNFSKRYICFLDLRSTQTCRLSTSDIEKTRLWTEIPRVENTR